MWQYAPFSFTVAFNSIQGYLYCAFYDTITQVLFEGELILCFHKTVLQKNGILGFYNWLNKVHCKKRFLISVQYVDYKHVG